MVGEEDLDNDVSLQGCAFTVAWEVFEENSYTNSFGGKESSLASVGKCMLKKYPGITFEGSVIMDEEWSNTLEVVKSTKNGRIIAKLEEF